MSSTILVQRAKEEALLAIPQTEDRRVSIETTMDHISLNKPCGSPLGKKAGQFEFDVTLTESIQTAESLKVKYMLMLKRTAIGETCNVSGQAVLRFSGFGRDIELTSLGEEMMNEIAVEIFRKNYETVYLLHDAFGIEAPSPWITQDVFFSHPRA